MQTAKKNADDDFLWMKEPPKEKQGREQGILATVGDHDATGSNWA